MDTLHAQKTAAAVARAARDARPARFNGFEHLSDILLATQAPKEPQ